MVVFHDATELGLEEALPWNYMMSSCGGAVGLSFFFAFCCSRKQTPRGQGQKRTYFWLHQRQNFVRMQADFADPVDILAHHAGEDKKMQMSEFSSLRRTLNGLSQTILLSGVLGRALNHRQGNATALANHSLL